MTTDEIPVESWDDGLKLLSAQMIAVKMAEMTGGGASIGMESESQGEYSYKKGSSKGGDYPDTIMAKLARYTYARMQFGTKQTIPHDQRGMSFAQLAQDKKNNYVGGVPYENQ